MQCTITIPDNFAGALGAILAEHAEKMAAGNRMVDLKEAVKITRKRRSAIVAAYKSKSLAHYIIDAKPYFKVTDLWTWLDKVRVEARQDR